MPLRSAIFLHREKQEKAAAKEKEKQERERERQEKEREKQEKAAEREKARQQREAERQKERAEREVPSSNPSISRALMPPTHILLYCALSECDKELYRKARIKTAMLGGCSPRTEMWGFMAWPAHFP